MLFECNRIANLETPAPNPFSLSVSFQIAHMTKSEMQYLDSSFIGPFLLFLNQYFNTFLNEKFVLWLALVGILWCDFLGQQPSRFSSNSEGIFTESEPRKPLNRTLTELSLLHPQIYSIIDIILYASSLCLQISSFLGIYIFSLKKRPPGKQDNRFKTVNGRESKRYNLRQQNKS